MELVLTPRLGLDSGFSRGVPTLPKIPQPHHGHRATGRCSQTYHSLPGARSRLLSAVHRNDMMHIHQLQLCRDYNNRINCRFRDHQLHSVTFPGLPALKKR